jgi:hypothetical protein
MIDCADSTALRAHLDHPDAALEAHLDDCGACAGLLRAVAADAGFTRRALGLLDPPRGAGPAPAAVEGALAAARAGAEPAPAVAPPPVPRRRRFLRDGRRPALAGAAAVVVLLVALTPSGRGAVAGVLDVFRGQRLQAVGVDPAWAASLGPEDVRTLGTLGDVDTAALHEPVPVADVAGAERVAGIAAPATPGPPDRLLALAPGTARLTLRNRNGNGVPADLDGATLVVGVPGAIGAIHGPADGPPEYVVGHSGPLVMRAEGASLAAIRSFLLGRPELPADLRSQLAAIDDWRSTVPVPVPLDGPGWRDVEVDGRPAIAFGDDSGTGAVVIRQDTDGVTVVGGRIGVGRALDLAARA